MEIKKIVLLVLFSFIFSNKIVSQVGLEISILNKSLKNGDTIFLKIINYSDIKYFLPIDFKYKGQPPMFINHNESLNFFPNFIIKNYSQNIAKYICSISDKENTLIDRKDYFKSTSDLLLIEAKSEKIIKIIFNKKNVFSDESYCEYLLDENSYSFQLIFSISKEIVEEFISDNLKKQLIKNKFQCYNGYISTNKIRLIN